MNERNLAAIVEQLEIDKDDFKSMESVRYAIRQPIVSFMENTIKALKEIGGLKDA